MFVMRVQIKIKNILIRELIFDVSGWKISFKKLKSFKVNSNLLYVMYWLLPRQYLGIVRKKNLQRMGKSAVLVGGRGDRERRHFCGWERWGWGGNRLHRNS